MPKIGVFISNVLPGIFILFIYLVNISKIDFIEGEKHPHVRH